MPIVLGTFDIHPQFLELLNEFTELALDSLRDGVAASHRPDRVFLGSPLDHCSFCLDVITDPAYKLRDGFDIPRHVDVG